MSHKEYHQVQFDEVLIDDCRQLIRLAIREDLDRGYDWTTLAIVSDSATGAADFVVRQPGVIAGLRAAEVALETMEVDLHWSTHVDDGASVHPGTVIASLSGQARAMLTAERILLNLVCRLSGIASLTKRFVDAIQGCKARVYDTRKTTPGWRRLEKYAVHCGGGRNHRTGLFDSILIKDNHLAHAAAATEGRTYSAGEAVEQALAFAADSVPDEFRDEMLIEVEVDTLDQLKEVLPKGPDIVLLDNMPPKQLCVAVSLRDELNPDVELEASGGVTLETIRGIAETGVERISVGALTHGAYSLDIGLDWR